MVYYTHSAFRGGVFPHKESEGKGKGKWTNTQCSRPAASRCLSRSARGSRLKRSRSRRGRTPSSVDGVVKGKKVINFKAKRRKGARRLVGHRQQLTVATVKEIA